MSLLDSILGQVGGNSLKDLAGSIGSDEGSTQNAMKAALPMLIGAVTKNASSKEGAASLEKALERDHDGGLLGNLGGLFGGAEKSKSADGEGILRHMLGSKRGAVEEVVAKEAGVDASKVSALLPKLAPLVMAALGKKKKEEGLDLSGLMGMLSKEKEDVKEKSGGLLGAFLDQDGDGELSLGDAKGLLGRFLK